MLISAKIVKPRKPWRCNECGEDFIMTPYLRLFGCAHRGDNPYVIKLHLTCCDWEDPKILNLKKEKKNG